MTLFYGYKKFDKVGLLLIFLIDKCLQKLYFKSSFDKCLQKFKSQVKLSF